MQYLLIGYDHDVVYALEEIVEFSALVEVHVLQYEYNACCREDDAHHSPD